jgi:hypothetical protein
LDDTFHGARSSTVTKWTCSHNFCTTAETTAFICTLLSLSPRNRRRFDSFEAVANRPVIRRPHRRVCKKNRQQEALLIDQNWKQQELAPFTATLLSPSSRNRRRLDSFQAAANSAVIRLDLLDVLEKKRSTGSLF